MKDNDEWLSGLSVIAIFVFGWLSLGFGYWGDDRNMFFVGVMLVMFLSIIGTFHLIDMLILCDEQKEEKK